MRILLGTKQLAHIGYYIFFPGIMTEKRLWSYFAYGDQCVYFKPKMKYYYYFYLHLHGLVSGSYILHYAFQYISPSTVCSWLFSTKLIFSFKQNAFFILFFQDSPNHPFICTICPNKQKWDSQLLGNLPLM